MYIRLLEDVKGLQSEHETGDWNDIPDDQKIIFPRGALFHNIHELFIEEWKGKPKLVRFQGIDDFGVKIGLVTPWTAITLYSENKEDSEVITHIKEKFKLEEGKENVL